MQTITPLENGGALTLTTALYYTKSGNSIQARGVKPDIEVEAEAVSDDSVPGVPSPLSDLREEDLPGAISNPSSAGQPAKEGDAIKKINKTRTIRPNLTTIDPEKEDIQVWGHRDNQFQRALDLLKTFSVFKVSQPPST